MKVKTLLDLFIHDLSDVYSAEKQITRALPKLIRTATDEKLKAAFQQHLDETQGQIERLDQVIDAHDELRLLRMKCHALEGLVEEAQELIEATEAGPVRDAGLIGAAQKVEHYEIATYGTLIALAIKLQLGEAANLLAATLEEEKSTDKKLTSIAEKQ
ncbi:ferritin-like domain-containing protein [Pantoea sp. S61]|uniref:YciE/YciF ferroxidase family protein n=1 Tax=Pantoea sp. S61 TaxID=2767442 RepID=UPI0019093878|nr:ferritin-like domain-containing protein [Pantoea sp. S61]MBK0122517.1 ferritin-like domain-containing protein [Pantoea sp. S61]MBK0122774.1 ferritin-like domain-containing protein [Pantoea sp. S61]